ncbi:MAG: hypothetical protein KatS3mg117_0925 [Geminicoccaceae bacterium]|jgi:hypothetical protein|nr:MAG: hypothetical protein KatS3mg117_0925 [Geminicoccaceae bacterium]
MTDSSRTTEATTWPFAAAPLVEAWMRANRVWVEAAGRCGARMIGFVGERLEADLEHGRKLAACRDLGAIAEAQSEWLRRAFEDYRREFEAFSKEMWSSLETLRSETARSVPTATGASESTEARPRERRAA